MLPYDTRPHRWQNGECTRCAMRQSWAGARYACEAPAGSHATTLSATERQTLRRKALHRRKRGATVHDIARRFGVSPFLVTEVLR